MSFQQGLSGLNASAKALDTIGNNIANSSTVGYKLSTAQFADVFAASLAGAGASPIGLGVKVATVAQQFTQGNVSITNNPLDLAINGGGFFRLQNAIGDPVYTRNGQFQLDKDGYIVNAKGQQLMGYAADPASGTINPPTVPLRLFDPTSSSDATPQATGKDVAGSGTGVGANVNLDSREAAIPAAQAMTAPAAPGLNASAPLAGTYNKSTATTIYDSLGNAHTYTMYFVKLPSPAVNSWDVYATVSAQKNAAGDTGLTALGKVTTLTFDSSGKLPAAAVPPPAPPGPGTAVMQAITADQLGFAGTAGPPVVLPGVKDLLFPMNFTGSTQYGAAFTVNSLAQDGYSSGKLAGFNIGSDGVVLGRYTNGQSKSLGQVVLSNFRNPQGLQPLGDNTWSPTSSAGPVMEGTPGSSGQYGPLQSAALEDSNVDLTAELVSMITQQRVYQANAQTIKTQDSILQTLVNLR